MAGKIEGTTNQGGIIYVYNASNMSFIKSESIEVGSYSVTGVSDDISVNIFFIPTDSGINAEGYRDVTPVQDYDGDAEAMCRSIQTGNSAYYMDYNEYGPDLETLKTEAYITSYTLDDTGDFNYYVSGDGEFAAWWEGGTRVVDEVTGRYTMDYDDANPTFRTDAQLTTWTGSFPA